jgi:hypothetical protein
MAVMKKVFLALMLAGMFFGAANVSASTAAYSGDMVSHSGGTDKNGCHRDTKAGTRHCH